MKDFIHILSSHEIVLSKSHLMGFELHKMYFVVLTVCNLSKLFRGKGSTGKPFHKFCFVTNKV